MTSSLKAHTVPVDGSFFSKPVERAHFISKETIKRYINKKRGITFQK
jgi:hypothetical protein